MNPSSDSLRAWIDIDLGALVRNGTRLAAHAGVPLLPMVKADAYGLGVGPVVRALEAVAPFGYGVATADEGRELRDLGITRPVLVFTPVLPLDFALLRAAKLTPTFGDAERIGAWIASGGGDWHLAIDTGMMRAGLRWDRMAEVAELARTAPPAGAFTHFHSSENDNGSMEVQEGRFRDAVRALPARPPLLHSENSGAIVRRSPSEWNLVRPGVFLYGIGSGAGAAFQPEPVAHLRARIVDLHDLNAGDTVSYGATWTAAKRTRLATVNVGYADGYRRSLGNAGTALLHGTRVRVAGTVTMDMTMLDVTGTACSLGDVITLMGRDGDALVTAEDVGAACGLSPYEVLTGLRQRLPRVPA
ncbi:MAG: alanine racemase [Gemmatimonadetes bacterium]|nr:alanine racemase [Gemmatimonadota bacterium]